MVHLATLREAHNWNMALRQRLTQSSNQDTSSIASSLWCKVSILELESLETTQPLQKVNKHVPTDTQQRKRLFKEHHFRYPAQAKEKTTTDILRQKMMMTLRRMQRRSGKLNAQAVSDVAPQWKSHSVYTAYGYNYVTQYKHGYNYVPRHCYDYDYGYSLQTLARNEPVHAPVIQRRIEVYDSNNHHLSQYTHV